MNLVNLALVVVFISNAVVLVLVVYLLVRILGQTEHTRFMMIRAARELGDSARTVREAGYRVVEALKTGSGAARGQALEVTATPVAGIEMLDRLNDMMEELAAPQEGASTDGALADIKQMIEGLRAADPARLAEWIGKHRAEIDNALAQRDRLAADTERMRQRLLEAHRIIMELRKANKAAEAAGHTVEQLRGEMNKQRQLLERAKERLHAAEAKAEQLTADVERLSEANPEGGAENEALKEARRRLAEVSKERDQQMRELDQLKEAMQRTLIEKDFIEEHFLRLDGSRQTLAAAADAAGAGGVAPTDAARAARQNDELAPA